MPVPIAELFVNVSADVNGAINGLTAVENRLNGTTSAFRQAAPAALVLAGAGAAIGTGFAGAVGVAATFEKQMSGVRAVMSPDEAKQFGSALDDLAISLGAATTFTAQQVAGAFEELLKLGVSAPAILGGAGQAVLGLAAATGAPLTDSATVAAQALNAFHLSVSELPGVVDVLAGVINVTAADLNDIKLGFSDVAAVAHGMGLSLTDTAVTLGIFRDNAVTGNTAGTALKTMLLGLQPVTKRQHALFDQLGITVNGANNAFFDAQGNVKDMASVAGVLQKALGGMTAQQRNATLETLFGTQGMIAANIIFSTGAESIRKYTSEVKKISAADQAAERLNNLLGRLEQLGGALQSVQIIVGKFFLPAIGAIADAAQKVLIAFTNLSPAAQRVITAVAGIAGAIAAAVAGFVLLGPAMTLLGPSFAVLISLLPRMLAIFGPIGIAVAALATDFLGIRTALGNTFSGAGAILKNFGSVFDKAVNGDISGAVDTLQAILGALIPGIGPILQTIRTIVQGFTTDVLPVLQNFGLAIQKLFAGDVSGAFDTFRAILGALSPPLGAFADVIARIAGSVGGAIGAFFTDVLPKVAEALGGFAAGAGEGFSTFFTQTLPPILAVAGSVAADIGAGLLTFFNTVVAPVADQALRFAGDIGSGLRTFFTETLPPIAVGVAQFAGEVGAGLFNFATTVLPVVADAAGKFAGDVGAGLSTFFNDHMPGVVTALGQFAANPGEAFLSFFRDSLPGVIANMTTWTVDTTAAMVDFFQHRVPSIIGGMSQFTPQSVQGFLSFFAGFDTAKANLISLGPFFESLGRLGIDLLRLAAAVARLAGIGSPGAEAIGAVGGTLRTLGEILQPVTDIFNNAAISIERLTNAIEKAPNLGALLTGGDLRPASAGGGAGGFVGGAPPPPAAVPATGNAQGGVSVNFNAPVSINGAGEFDTFLARVSNAVADAAGRVAVPPDNSSHPTLLPSVT